MSDSKKLSVGKELTDDELMEMTGGKKFCNIRYRQLPLKPSNPVAKYGVLPDLTVKYGAMPLYGIEPRTLYGIDPY